MGGRIGKASSKGPLQRTDSPDDDATKPWGPHSYAFIVWRGENMRPRDDPYYVSRIGTEGQEFRDIPRGNGRRSDRVRRSHTPEFKSGFIIDAEGIDRPWLHIVIDDSERFDLSNNNGHAAASISWLLSATKDHPVALPLKNGNHKGSEVYVEVGPPDLLDKKGIEENPNFPRMKPNGRVKPCRVREMTADFPLVLGRAPLPKQLRGIFWLTDQGKNSACMSFGGPTNDGGGCSTGKLQNKTCRIRVYGDRCWALADRRGTDEANARINDVIYHFTFDSEKDPKHGQIFTEAKVQHGWVLKNDVFLDYEMALMKDGDPMYPGSIVWIRYSYMLRKEQEDKRYKVVQIFDEHGEKLEPAFSKFAEYQESGERPHPGTVFYREIRDTE